MPALPFLYTPSTMTRTSGTIRINSIPNGTWVVRSYQTTHKCACVYDKPHTQTRIHARTRMHTRSQADIIACTRRDFLTAVDKNYLNTQNGLLEFNQSEHDPKQNACYHFFPRDLLNFVTTRFSSSFSKTPSQGITRYAGLVTMV